MDTFKIINETEIITPRVKLHYPSLFEPREVPGADTRKDGSKKKTYQAVALFPPSVDLKPLKNILRNAITDKFGAKFKMPASKNPIHDAAEKEERDGFEEGWHFVNLSANYPPAVVDQKKRPLLTASDLLGKTEEERKQVIADAESRIYAGCWVRIHMNAYTWEHPTGGRGVSLGLKAVQLVQQDEPFSIGGSSSADAFDEIDGVDDDDIDFGDDDDDGDMWA